MASSATIVLPEPTSPLEQPQHAPGRGHVGADLGQGLALARRETEGQGGLDPVAHGTGTRARPAALVADAGAHEAERHLARQQFVIGETLPRRRLGAEVSRRIRRMQGAQRRLEARPLQQQRTGRLQPLVEGRQAFERSLHGLGEDAGVEPLGQAVDGLDGRQRGEILGRHDAFGMHHLQMSVPHFELARDPARGAERQRLLDPQEIVEEEDQRERAGVVLDHHFEGGLAARVAGWQVAHDPPLKHDDAVARRERDFRPGAAVDQGVRQVQQQVDDAGRAVGTAEQPIEQRSRLRPHALERGGRGEQRIEVGWSQGDRARAAGKDREVRYIARLRPAQSQVFWG